MPVAAQIVVGADARPVETSIVEALKRAERHGINLKFNTRGFNRPLGSISADLKEFDKSLDASNARVLAFAASAGILYQVVGGFKAVIKSAVEVEKALTDINVVLNLNQSSLKSFSSSLFDIQKITGQGFSEVAKAATELARQGLGAEETLKRTRDALILTRLTGLDAAESVQDLTAAINSFKNETLDSTKIINTLATVDASFAVSSKDLAEAIKRVGSTADDAGVSFNQLIALVTSAQQTTARGGSVIGNAFKTIFTRIERPEVLEQLSKLGIAVRDLGGQTVPAIKILEDLASRLDTLSSVQRSQVQELLGGVFQINQLKAVLSDLSKEYSTYGQALKTASGATDNAIRRNEELNKTTVALFNETAANFTKFAGTIGKSSFEPAIRQVLGLINTGLQAIDFSESESVGAKIGEGIVKGISNFIKGPGIAVGLALIYKAVKRFSQDLISAQRSLLDLGKGLQEQVILQKTITSVLLQNPEILDQIRRGTLANAEAEQLVLGKLREELVLRERILGLSATYASGAAQLGLGVEKGEVKLKIPKTKTKAAGFVPEIQEKVAAYQAGYRPGEVRSMNINGVGKVYYNTAEKVKDFGLGQPAIMPPKNSPAGANYKQAFQKKLGFDPYSAEGYVPNFIPIQREYLRNRRWMSIDFGDYAIQRTVRSNRSIKPQNMIALPNGSFISFNRDKVKNAFNVGYLESNARGDGTFLLNKLKEYAAKRKMNLYSSYITPQIRGPKESKSVESIYPQLAIRKKLGLENTSASFFDAEGNKTEFTSLTKLMNHLRTLSERELTRETSVNDLLSRVQAGGFIPKIGRFANSRLGKTLAGSLLGASLGIGGVKLERASRIQESVPPTYKFDEVENEFYKQINQNKIVKGLRDTYPDGINLKFVNNTNRPNLHGQYFSSADLIHLNKAVQNPDFEATFFHELGHKIDMGNNITSGTNFTKVIDALQRDTKTLGMSFNSAVGISTNGDAAMESFAEIFSKAAVKDYKFNRTNDIRNLQTYKAIKARFPFVEARGLIPNFANMVGYHATAAYKERFGGQINPRLSSGNMQGSGFYAWKTRQQAESHLNWLKEDLGLQGEPKIVAGKFNRANLIPDYEVHTSEALQFLKEKVTELENLNIPIGSKGIVLRGIKQNDTGFKFIADFPGGMRNQKQLNFNTSGDIGTGMLLGPLFDHLRQSKLGGLAEFEQNLLETGKAFRYVGDPVKAYMKNYSAGLVPNFANKYALGYGKFRPNFLGLRDIFKAPGETLKNLPIRLAGGIGSGLLGSFLRFKGDFEKAQPYLSMSRYFFGMGGVRDLKLTNKELGILGNATLLNYEPHSPGQIEAAGGEYFNTIGRYRVGKNAKRTVIQDAFDFDNSVDPFSGVSKIFGTGFQKSRIGAKASKIVESFISKFGTVGENQMYDGTYPSMFKAGPVTFKTSPKSDFIQIIGEDLNISKYGNPFLTRISAGEPKKDFIDYLRKLSGQKTSAKGFVPNFMPYITQNEARTILQNRRFKSFTYEDKEGQIREYHLGQHHVRRDLIQGQEPPKGYGSWTEFDEATDSLVLWNKKENGETKFRRFRLETIKQIRADNDIFDVFGKGFVPNFAAPPVQATIQFLKNMGANVTRDASKGALARNLSNTINIPRNSSMYTVLHELGHLADNPIQLMQERSVNNLVPGERRANANAMSYIKRISPQAESDYLNALRDPFKSYKIGFLLDRLPVNTTPNIRQLRAQANQLSTSTTIAEDLEYRKTLSALLRATIKEGIGFSGFSQVIKEFKANRPSQYRQSLGSPMFARGLIPNFVNANPAIAAAIKREASAGVPKNLIRIGTDTRLESSYNPLGIGVYNQIHEPFGLGQGINRSLKQGLNPKVAGLAKGFVPNFAPVLEIDPALGQSEAYMARAIKKATEQYERLARTLRAGGGIGDISKVGDLFKSFSLTEKSLKGIRLGLENVKRGYFSPGGLKPLQGVTPMKEFSDRYLSTYVEGRSIRNPLNLLTMNLAMDNPKLLSYLNTPTPSPKFTKTIAPTRRAAAMSTSVDQPAETYQALSNVKDPTSLIGDIKQRLAFLDKQVRTFDPKKTGRKALTLDKLMGAYDQLLQAPLTEETKRTIRARRDINLFQGGFTTVRPPVIGGGGGRGGTLPQVPASQIYGPPLPPGFVTDSPIRQPGSAIVALANAKRQANEPLGPKGEYNGSPGKASGGGYFNNNNAFLQGKADSAERKRQAENAAQANAREKMAFEQEVGRLTNSIAMGSAMGLRWNSNKKAMAKLLENPLAKNNPELARQNEMAQKEGIASLSSKGFALSFVAPQVAGVLSSMIGDKTQKSRIGGAAVEGLGDVASFAGLGLSLFPAAGPVALGVGAGVGGISMIIRVMNAWMDQLPELQKRLEDSSSKLSEFQNAFQGYTVALENYQQGISDTSGKISAQDVLKRQDNLTESLIRIPEQFRTKVAAAVGDADKIREVFSDINKELTRTAEANAAAVRVAQIYQSRGFFNDTSFENNKKGKQNLNDVVSTVGGLINTDKMTPAQMDILIEKGRFAGTTALEGKSDNYSKFIQSLKLPDDDLVNQLKRFEGKNSDSAKISFGLANFISGIKNTKRLTEIQTEALKRNKENYEKFAVRMSELNKQLDANNNALQARIQVAQIAVGGKNELEFGKKAGQRQLALSSFGGQLDLARPFLTPERTSELEGGYKLTQISSERNGAIENILSATQKDFLQNVSDSLNKRFQSLNSIYAQREIGKDLDLTNTTKANIEDAASKALSAVFGNLTQQVAKNPNAAAGGIDLQDLAKALRERNVSEVDITDIISNTGKLFEQLQVELAKTTLQYDVQSQRQEEENQMALKLIQQQKRLEFSGGIQDFLGGSGVRGKLNDSLSTITQGIFTQGPGKSITTGRGNLQLSDILVNSFGFKASQLPPELLGRSVEGRKQDILQQLDLAQRITGAISQPSDSINEAFKQAQADAQKIAEEQVAALLKIENLPANVANIDASLQSLVTLMSTQLQTYQSSNEAAFKAALQATNVDTLATKLDAINNSIIASEEVRQKIDYETNKFQTEQKKTDSLSSINLVSEKRDQMSNDFFTQTLDAIANTKQGVGIKAFVDTNRTSLNGSVVVDPQLEQIIDANPTMSLYRKIAQIQARVKDNPSELPDAISRVKDLVDPNIKRLTEIDKVSVTGPITAPNNAMKTVGYLPQEALPDFQKSLEESVSLEIQLASAQDQVAKSVAELARLASIREESRTGKYSDQSRNFVGEISNFDYPKEPNNYVERPSENNISTNVAQAVAAQQVARAANTSSAKESQAKLISILEKSRQDAISKFKNKEVDPEALKGLGQIFKKEDAIKLNDQLAAAKANLYLMNEAGHSFSNELRAAQDQVDELNIRLKKGISPLDASARMFDQWSYNVRDFYKDFKDGAIEVGQTMKSSFSDAFKSFAHGTASATEALRNLGLAISNKVLDKSLDMATNFIFSGLGTAGQGLTSYFQGLGGKNAGGLIKRYSSGGPVVGGSGYKDDVPAMLSQGEYVIRRASANKIGINRLNALNYGGYLKRADGGKVDLVLDNQYVYDSPTRPTKGWFKVDPRLSNYALEDDNNPQNTLRVQREEQLGQYLADKAAYDEQVKKSKKAFKKQKDQALDAAFVAAAINIAGAGFSYGMSNSAGRGLNGRAVNVGTKMKGSIGIDAPARTGMPSNTMWSNKGGYMRGYAAGGSVFGGDTPQDNIPAMLTGGEYVVRADTVRRFGVNFFDKLNRGTTPGFATGGFVGTQTTGSSNTQTDLSTMLQSLTAAIESLRSTLPGGDKENKNTQENSESSGGNVYITNTINIANGDVKTNGEGKSDGDKGSTNPDNVKKLIEMINNQTKQIIMQEKRPGGLLDPKSQ